MTDPRRLLEGGTDFEARLLGSALDDAPSPGLDRRVQATLGVGGVAIGASTATATAAAASKVAPLLMSFGVAKWVGIVAIGAIGTGAAVGAVVVHRRVVTRSVSLVSVSPAVFPVAPVKRSAAARPMDPAFPLTFEIPSAAAVSSPAPVFSSPLATRDSVHTTQAAVATRPSEAPVEATADLVSELALLDRAHRALDSGDAQLALATLDRRDLEFAHGDLAPESLALRIEAYALRHDSAKVRELGQSFLARYPAHPQSRRVRSMMDGDRRP